MSRLLARPPSGCAPCHYLFGPLVSFWDATLATSFLTGTNVSIVAPRRTIDMSCLAWLKGLLAEDARLGIIKTPTLVPIGQRYSARCFSACVSCVANFISRADFLFCGLRMRHPNWAPTWTMAIAMVVSHMTWFAHALSIVRVKGFPWAFFSRYQMTSIEHIHGAAIFAGPFGSTHDREPPSPSEHLNGRIGWQWNNIRVFHGYDYLIP